jgi:hypothetical protein
LPEGGGGQSGSTTMAPDPSTALGQHPHGGGNAWKQGSSAGNWLANGLRNYALGRWVGRARGEGERPAGFRPIAKEELENPFLFQIFL